jgi:hypothetical protein
LRLRPPERVRTDIESKNLGLIAAWRPELTPSENQARDAELQGEIQQSPFGFLHVRGQYVSVSGSASERLTAHAYLLIGNPDDSGNLRGFLRKTGRKFQQDAVIHKGYYRDAELIALRELPDLGLRDKEKTSLGMFSPAFVGQYFTLLTTGGDRRALAHLQEAGEPQCVDWRGGYWEDVGFWSPKSFSARREQRVYFESAAS